MRARHQQASGSLPAPIPGSHRQPRTPAARVWSVTSVIGRFVTVIAVAVAALTVLTLAWFNVQHQQVLIVTSGSMAPAFNAGDGVIVARTDPSRLRVGDVVTFAASAGGKSTTHRIHELMPRPEGLFLQTKGDANATLDPNLVAASNVTGVMTGTIPYMGFWLDFYQSPLGKVLILGTPLLLILIGQTVSMLGDWRGARRTRAQVGAEEPDADQTGCRHAEICVPPPQVPPTTTLPLPQVWAFDEQPGASRQAPLHKH